MRKDRELATELRRSGKSYRQIRSELKIPLGTLSEWFSKEGWSNDIRQKVTDAANKVSAVRMRELDRIRGVHLAKIYDEAREEAIQEFQELKYNPLFITGIMLYWGEGDKQTGSMARLANTDPAMIRLFVIFLTKVCRIPQQKIRMNALIYPDLQSHECVKYWSTAAQLPVENFTKCVTILGRHKTKRLSFGVCNVTVSSTYFKTKLSKWLELLPKELMNGEYYASIEPTRI